jgi:DNA-binding Lrp family transcriptional regulator
MDLISKQLLLELNRNCRMSLQSLARKLDLSVNGVKKRLQRLTETGIIRGYFIYPTLAMLDAESVVAILTIADSAPEDSLLDKIGASPMVYAASILSSGHVLVFADYEGTMGLSELGAHLRQFPEVSDVELHTIITERGAKRELKTSQLKVLKCLREDPRMPISQIAEATQLTPRRVRKILKDFLGNGGADDEFFVKKQSIGDLQAAQACIYFRVIWDLNAGGATAFIVRIERKEDTGMIGDVVEWLQQHFPMQFWYTYASATKPTLFNVFIVDHMSEAKTIIKEINTCPFVESAQVIFGYPTKQYTGLRDLWFEKMLGQLDE